MLTEAIMHDCVVKLLKNHDEESLECLCRLLTTIGKDLDFEKAKVGVLGFRRVVGRHKLKFIVHGLALSVVPGLPRQSGGGQGLLLGGKD